MNQLSCATAVSKWSVLTATPAVENFVTLSPTSTHAFEDSKLIKKIRFHRLRQHLPYKIVESCWFAAEQLLAN